MRGGGSGGRWGVSALGFEVDAEGACGGFLVAVPGDEELMDFAEEGVAVFVPFLGSAEDEGAFAEADEADFLGAGAAEVFEFVAEGFEEGEFEGVAGFHGGADQ